MVGAAGDTVGLRILGFETALGPVAGVQLKPVPPVAVSCTGVPQKVGLEDRSCTFVNTQIV